MNVTMEEFASAPAEIHIECDATGKLTKVLKGDLTKQGYLVTEAATSVLGGASSLVEIETLEKVMTDCIHAMALKHKMQLMKSLGLASNAKTLTPNDLPKILSKLFGEQ